MNSAHEPVSGFAKDECDSIRAGVCPASFDARKRLAYEVAKALTTQKGPLSEDLWAESVKVGHAVRS